MSKEGMSITLLLEVLSKYPILLRGLRYQILQIVCFKIYETKDLFNHKFYELLYISYFTSFNIGGLSKIELQMNDEMLPDSVAKKIHGISKDIRYECTFLLTFQYVENLC